MVAFLGDMETQAKGLAGDREAQAYADAIARQHGLNIDGSVRRETVTLPTDSQARKDTPIFSGVVRYFPLALAEIARLSKAGNDKHNPGQPLHWSRGKSNDHADCAMRHLIEVGTIDPDDGHRHPRQPVQHFPGCFGGVHAHIVRHGERFSPITPVLLPAGRLPCTACPLK